MSWQEFHLERHIFSSNADTRAHFARVVRRVAQNETGRTFGECHFRDVIFKSASRHTRSGGTQVELGQELSAVLRPAAAAHSQGVAAIWREARFLHIATEQCCKFPDSGLDSFACYPRCQMGGIDGATHAHVFPIGPFQTSSHLLRDSHFLS